LIEGNTLFVDGTKIRANASTRNTWTKKKCDRYLAKIDKRINDILSECDAADEREAGRPSLVKMKEELKNSELLRIYPSHGFPSLLKNCGVMKKCNCLFSVDDSLRAYHSQHMVLGVT